MVLQPSGRTREAAGPSVERAERTSDIRDRLSGVVEASARRNGSGAAHHGDHSKHKAVEESPLSSTEAVSLILFFKVIDLEKTYTSSRNGSASNRAIVSSSRLNSSSLEPPPYQVARAGRLVSSGGNNRPSGLEPRPSSLTRSLTARGSRDEPPIQNFELLSIGANKKK